MNLTPVPLEPLPTMMTLPWMPDWLTLPLEPLPCLCATDEVLAWEGELVKAPGPLSTVVWPLPPMLELSVFSKGLLCAPPPAMPLPTMALELGSGPAWCL